MTETLTHYDRTNTPDNTADTAARIDVYQVPKSNETIRSIGDKSVSAAAIASLVEQRVKHENTEGYDYGKHF